MSKIANTYSSRGLEILHCICCWSPYSFLGSAPINTVHLGKPTNTATMATRTPQKTTTTQSNVENSVSMYGRLF